MADLNNSMSGLVVSAAVSTDDGVTWKKIVCSIGDTVVRGTQTGGAETASRCGTAKAPGTTGWEFSGAGISNTAVTSGTEVSHNEMAALFQNGTSARWRVQYDTDPTDYYREGAGFVSAYDETAPIDGFVQFTYTVKINGLLDLSSAA